MRLIILSTTMLSALSIPAFGADQFNTVASTPDWSLTVGALYMVRSDSGKHGLFYDGQTPLGLDVVDSRDLGHSSTWGIEAALNGNVFDRNLEIRGMWTTPSETSWDGDEQSGSGGFSLGGQDPFGFGLFGGDGLFALDAERETTFLSLEGNIEVARIGSAEAFVGVRGFWIDDDLFLEVDSTPNVVGPGFNTTGDVEVSNRLIGPQIGVRTRFDNLSSDVFALNGFAKLGLMNNHSEAKIEGGGNLGGASSGQAKDDDTSWVTMVEAGLDGVITVTSNMSIELGYQVLYLDGIGTSTATLGNTFWQTANGISTSVGEDRVLYHSGHVRAVWRF